MSDKLTRRDFLKISGLSVAATAVLTGCGPAARYVARRPYVDMPEYSAVGKSTYFATACRECPAGCGLILRTMEGRAIKAEGNPAHPVNRGKICSRGLTAVQGLYNPERIRGPVRRNGEQLEELTWDEALALIRQALSNPAATAFYFGLNHDHLFDLAGELSQKIGAPAAVRFGALGMFEARATLAAASETLFGAPSFPYFDIGASDLVISFGASFMETWVSPVAYSRGYGQLRRSAEANKKRGYMVSIEPRRSFTGGNADEWLAVRPGSEGLVALALAKLLQEKFGASPLDISAVNPQEAADSAGIPLERLVRLVERIAAANAPVFIPGGVALSHASGLQTALQILALNVAVGAVGRAGGLFPAPATPLSSSLADVQALIARMQAGDVETLFIHGANPLFELPSSLGFSEALEKVKTVISFASFPDETATAADYIFPDHTPLEGWGYQRTLAGSDRQAVSSAQPVVVPLYDTRATADLLIAAGGLPYSDEVDFLQKSLARLMADPAGSIQAPEVFSFFAEFQQKGGWWHKSAGLALQEPAALPAEISQAGALLGSAEGQFHLLIYPTQLGDGSGANRPWLQETPNADTTVMWNSWVEIHPHTAEELGLHDDDVVRIESAAGVIEAVVYKYPAIRPDTIAIPFGQGHTALGRWAEGRGANPIVLVPAAVSDGGDLALGDTFVTIKTTGRRRPLSRYESREGVYKEH
jgi:anaerobic selenocysteine-containing dehydrogenase